MRLLHIITGLNNGGAEANLYRLVTSDRQNTHQIISMMGVGVYGDRLAASGIPVHTLNMTRGRISLKGLTRLYRLIRDINPEVVQTWMYHADLIGGAAARITGKSAVVWGVRAAATDRAYYSRSTQVVVWMCAALSRVVPRTIIVNSARGRIIHRTLGYPDNRMVVVPNGYDYSQFRPDANSRMKVRDELGIKQNQILIGMVARWDPIKDHANLITAISLLKAEKLPYWSCLLVGPDMDWTNDRLSELLDKHGVRDRVILIGPRHDIPAIMNALDLHVLSSVAEAFPNVVAEAMACSTPVVVTDVGDTALIVGETGWVVPPSNSRALADALKESMLSIEDQETWLQRRAASRTRIVEDFSLERMLGSYSRIWRRTLDKKRG